MIHTCSHSPFLVDLRMVHGLVYHRGVNLQSLLDSGASGFRYSCGMRLPEGFVAVTTSQSLAVIDFAVWFSDLGFCFRALLIFIIFIPICSMVLVYLPTTARTKSPRYVGKYTSTMVRINGIWSLFVQNKV